MSIAFGYNNLLLL